MISEKLITGLAEEHLAGSDRFIVNVSVKPGNRILVFIDSDSAVLIEHCISLSRFIESKLDRDTEDFELNVSSSGLDQPYRLARQYKKNIGRQVSVVLNDGNKTEGTLSEADDEQIVITSSHKEKKIIVEEKHTLKYSEIKETKEIIKF